MSSLARNVWSSVTLACLLLSADGCSSPGCIRNSDCPINQDCVASTCQLPVAGTSAPAAGSSARGTSGTTGFVAGASGTFAGVSGTFAGASGVGTGGQISLDAGITDASFDAQTP